MIVQLIFADGSLVEGESFREAEEKLRASQWRRYRSRRSFRAAMRRRAGLWSGVEVGRSRRSEDFLRSLAGAGLFVLNVADGDEPLSL